MQEATQIWELATRLRVRALSVSDPLTSQELQEFANSCEQLARRIDPAVLEWATDVTEQLPEGKRCIK